MHNCWFREIKLEYKWVVLEYKEYSQIDINGWNYKKAASYIKQKTNNKNPSLVSRHISKKVGWIIQTIFGRLQPTKEIDMEK